jgi:hypothetical protein
LLFSVAEVKMTQWTRETERNGTRTEKNPSLRKRENRNKKEIEDDGWEE